MPSDICLHRLRVDYHTTAFVCCTQAEQSARGMEMVTLPPTLVERSEGAKLYVHLLRVKNSTMVVNATG